MNSVYIAGFGAIPVGKYFASSETDLDLEVIVQAMQNTGIEPSMIEGLFTTPNLNNYTGLQASLVCEAMRLSCKVAAEVSCGGMAGGAVLRYAYDEIALGQIRCAVVYAAEREYSLMLRLEQIAHSKGEGNRCYDPVVQPFAGLGFIWNYACSARRYMHDYGATEEDFAMAAVRDSKNAANNPLAAFNSKQINIDDVLASSPVSTPIKQLDACSMRDGAAAIVLVDEEIARERIEVPLRIAGIGEYHDNSNFIPTDQLKPLHTFVAATKAAREALERSDKTLKDIDVAELYAPFSPQELMLPEDIGWFDKGEMIKRIWDNSTSRDGEIPINTLGGLLGRGHPAYVTPLYEVIDLFQQLNGRAGEGQVTDAATGFMQCEGGMLNNVLAMVLEKSEGKR